MGAIVVGLGQIGGLSPGLLESSMRSALLDFALKVAYWPDARFGDFGRPRSAAVTCLLVGTGAGGLPVGDSLEAMLRAAVATNQALAEQALDSRVLIDRLELLELYEDVAIRPPMRWAGSCRTSSSPTPFAGRPPRRNRPRPAVAGCASTPPTSGTSASKSSARTTVACASCSRPTGRAPRKRWPPASWRWPMPSSRSPAATPGRTPKRPRRCTKCCCRCACANWRRSRAIWSSSSIASRPYPWELLENRWSNGERPPSVAAGFVRQFRTAEFRQQPVHSLGNTALVIGNPTSRAARTSADLPGARDEARQVAEQLAPRL
jgi:hypothetical protein